MSLHALPTKLGKEQVEELTPSSTTVRFSRKTLALAFAIAAVSDAIGAVANLAPPIAWLIDLGTALLLFIGAGTTVVTIARTSSGGDPRFGRASILAVGGRVYCFSGYPSTEI